jgi:DNA polymerase-3 subunit alpha
MKNYIPIHAHSCYSFGDGSMSVENYVKKVKELGMLGASLTEHGNMASSLKFYKECKRQNVNPILGIEAYLNDNRDAQKEENEAAPEEEIQLKDYDKFNSHVVLLAKNYQGYKDLVHLSGEAVMNGFYYKPRTKNDLIFEKAGNIMISTACQGSQWANKIRFADYKGFVELVRKYKAVFKDDFYLEVQFLEDDSFQKDYNDALIEIGSSENIKVIVGLDAHYVDEEDWYLQKVKMMINQKANFDDLKNPDFKIWLISQKGFFVKPYNQLIDFGKKYGYSDAQIEGWLDNTLEINSKVNIEIPFYKFSFPKCKIPDGFTNESYFTKLCIEGFKNRLEEKRIPKEKRYLDQLKYEMDIIKNKGFAGYFLLIKSVIEKVKELGGRTGAGRGSAVGSLVSFCLNITNLDPIANSLYFERFLNPERKDPCDIDCDFSSDEQKMIEEELKKEYGHQSVAHIANYIKFGAKSIVRDLSRVNNFDFTLTNELSKMFDEEKNLKENIDNLKTKKLSPELSQYIDNHEAYIVKWGEKLENQVRNAGSHASGTVISPGKLYDFIPIIRLKNQYMTAFQEGGDEREVSEIGLVKLDLLGLNTCSIINDTLKLVLKRTGTDIALKMETDLLKDQKVYEKFREGDTLDIFQFGSPGMKSILQQSKPSTFEDIATINSLYRPASINAGFVAQYIENKNDPTKIKYIHPKLEPILGKTYGVITYQEQVMGILRAIGGFTLAEADKARKIMKLLNKTSSNQDPIIKAEFDHVLEKFKVGALENGLDERQMNQLLDQMAKYSEYSFCAAHAAGYALNAYQQMWLKVYYPYEYFASLLNRVIQENTLEIIKEAKRNKINLIPFDINKSNYEFALNEKNDIVMGFKIIKGVGTEEIKKLIECRPFESMEDFLQKAVKQKVSKRVIEPLIQLGVLSHWQTNRKSILSYYYKLKEKKKKDNPTFVLEEDYSNLEKTEFETKYLGFYLQEHPISKYNEILTKYKVTKVSQVDVLTKTIAGILQKVQVKKTKTNKTYHVLTIADEEKSIDVKVWAQQIPADFIVGYLLVLTNVDNNKYGYSTKSFTNIKVIKG